MGPPDRRAHRLPLGHLGGSGQMRLSHRIAAIVLAAIVGMTSLTLTVTPTAAATSPFSDIGGSSFRDEIEWLAAEGITSGCGAGRFCPDGLVTRGQMASFLARMFDLASSSTDRFDDDDGSRHEAAIDAIAAAGITAGCATEAYCPRGIVTRAQMATFLVRAADLGPSQQDYFLDDERSSHEPNINRMALAGVTGGCGFHRFCPGGLLTRGQMAALLYRVAHPQSAPAALPARPALPACRYDDVLTSRRRLADWPTSLLDTIYRVPATFAPTDLADSSAGGANGGYRIRRVAIADFAALVSAARSAGRPIRIVSAYRSHASQVATLAHWVALVGEAAALRRSARPGHSEHQLGTTLDVTHVGGAAPWAYADWASHPTGAWMRDNAWRHGFVMSYPRGASATSCYDYEPWHYRYVGREMAREIHLSGITLREWIWRIHGP